MGLVVLGAREEQVEAVAAAEDCLPGSQWHEVGENLIHHLGNPSVGAAEIVPDAEQESQSAAGRGHRQSSGVAGMDAAAGTGAVAAGTGGSVAETGAAAGTVD